MALASSTRQASSHLVTTCELKWNVLFDLRYQVKQRAAAEHTRFVYGLQKVTGKIWHDTGAYACTVPFLPD